jgi:murein DD-endopeptidase MepM/ murein hydrolase activator NlpD
MRLCRLSLAVLSLGAALGAAPRAQKADFAASVAEDGCTLGRSAARFPLTQAQIFSRILLQGVQGEALVIDWVDPQGEVQQSLDYGPLPKAPSLCMVSQLPVFGFPAGERAGAWQVVARLNGREIVRASFELASATGTTAAAAAAFVPLPSSGGYRVPFASGETWMMTQGPYGGFSHWGRATHAWDFAPRYGASCLVAMRSGTVVASADLGLGQTPHRRIFGNYISIAHEDGELSHYAHLESGTFRVRSGQYVEQGQALARVGNSGYSFGRHVHVSVTRGGRISTQSIPFRYEDWTTRSGLVRPQMVTSANASSWGSCGAQAPYRAGPQSGLVSSTARPAGPAPIWAAQVGFAQMVSSTLQVPRGERFLEVSVQCEDEAGSINLFLISPERRQHEHTTAMGGACRDRRIRIPAPQAGAWSIFIQGQRGEATAFRVYSNITPQRRRG